MSVKFKKGVDAVNNRIINVASPTGSTDAVNKTYVDNLIEGLSYKNEVRAATTTNGTLATAYANGQTIDGITLATGDRILIKNQTTQTENGIYNVAASGAPTRSTDADTPADMNNATVYVTNGTVNSGFEFTQTTKNPILGTDNVVFVQKTTGTVYTADGNGIEVATNIFSLELDGTTLSKSASGVRIGSGAAGAGLVEASGVLAVGANTGITVNANDIQIDTAVVPKKYAADCAATTNPQTFTHGLGTNDITVAVWASNELVFPDITKGSGTVIIDWGVAPSAAEYRVVVHG